MAGHSRPSCLNPVEGPRQAGRRNADGACEAAVFSLDSSAAEYNPRGGRRHRLLEGGVTRLLLGVATARAVGRKSDEADGYTVLMPGGVAC